MNFNFEIHRVDWDCYGDLKDSKTFYSVSVLLINKKILCFLLNRFELSGVCMTSLISGIYILMMI